MSNSQSNRIQELFLKAVELPADKRDAWLIQQCGDDNQLLAEVRALLEHDNPTIDELEDGLEGVTLSEIGLPKEAAGIHIRCPHCHNPVELVDDDSFDHVTCGSCGSQFSLIGAEGAEGIDGESTQSIGHFDLIEKVGMGAFGSVYMAKDTKLDRTVAIKIPRKQQLSVAEREKFLREARTGAQLRHPNIVSVYEVGRLEDQIYIVSDFVEGVTLKEWMTRLKPTPRESARLCVKIARALDHAHEHGVIHRDLKPGNIMLDGDDEPHLMDFGLAKRVAGEITMTMEGQILGTPAFMSPEQARGEGHDVDRRTDIYAMGVILFQMLTGELPFRGDVQMLLHQLLTEDAPSPRKYNSAVPSDLETICLKCMEKDPDRRYDTAAELANDIERYLEHRPIEARRISSTERLWRWCRRRPVIAGLAAMLVITLITGTIVSTYFAVQTSNANKELTLSIGKAQREERKAKATRDFLLKDLLEQVDLGQQADSLRSFGGNLIFVEKNPRIEDLLDRAAAKITADRIEAKFPGAPLVQAEVLKTIGEAYYSLNNYKRAIEHLERAKEIYEAQNDSDVETLIIIDRALSEIYGSEGRVLDAIQMAERVYERSRNSLGKHHAETVEAMDDLAWLYQQSGKTKKSLELIENAVAIARTHLGDDSKLVLMRCLSTLGGIYSLADNHQKAIEAEKEALALCRSELGESHPSTYSIKYSFAMALSRTGRTGEAITLFNETKEYYTQAFGRDSEQAINIDLQLAAAYSNAGLEEQAIDLLEETVDSLTSREETDFVRFGVSASYLAAAYANKGQHEKAIELIKPVIEKMIAKYGKDNYMVMSMETTLALSLHGTGRYAEARTLYQGIARRSLAVFGESHSLTRDASYAALITTQKLDPEKDLRPMFLEELAIRRRLWGEDHPKTQKVKTHIQRTDNPSLSLKNKAAAGKVSAKFQSANEFYHTREYEKAIPLYEAALKELRANDHIAKEPLDVGWVIWRLGVCYWRIGQREKAVVLFEESLAIFKPIVGMDHPISMANASFLAAWHRSKGDTQKDNEYLQHVYRWDIKEARKNPEDHERLIDRLMRYSLNQSALGKHNHAVPAAREALELFARKMPDDHRLFWLKSSLGEALIEQGKDTLASDVSTANKLFGEAEPLVIDGYYGTIQRMTKTSGGNFQVDTPRKALQRIIGLYEVWDKPEKLAAWKEKQAAIELASTKADELRERATEEAKAGKLTEAIALREEAASLPGQFPREPLPDLYAQVMNWDKAADVYQKVYLDSWQSACAMYAAGRVEEYLAMRRKLLESFPSNPQEWMPNSYLYASQFLPLEPDLHDFYRKVIKINNDSKENHRQRLNAAATYRLGEFDEWYSALPKDSPLRTGGVTELIAALAAYQKAPSTINRDTLDRQTRRHDGFAHRLLEKGYLEESKWKSYIEYMAWIREAMQVLNGGKEITLKEIEAYRLEGKKLLGQIDAHIKADNVKEAIISFEALQKIPAQPIDQRMLRILLIRTQQWDKARQLSNEITKERMDYEHVAILYQLGDINKYKAARAKLLAGHEKITQDWESHAFTGVAVLEPFDEDNKVAIRAMAKRNAASKISWVNSMVGRAMYRLGEFDDWFAKLPEDSPLREGLHVQITITRFQQDPSPGNRKALADLIERRERGASDRVKDGVIFKNWRQFIEDLAWTRECKRVLNEKK